MHFDDINMDNNYTPSGAYGRSKLANILFTAELANRLKGKPGNDYRHHGRRPFGRNRARQTFSEHVPELSA